MSENKNTYSKTLERGVLVLKTLHDAPRALSITRLSEATGLDRAVLYRMLATLAQHQLVERDGQTRRWRSRVTIVPRDGQTQLTRTPAPKQMPQRRPIDRQRVTLRR